MMASEKVDEMADDPREDPELVVNTFLQHKSLEQMQDYLARGRRFTTFDVRKLTKEWITAVRSWLAHKDHTKERMMDDLAAELRLRELEPPYFAVEQELADCSAQTKETEGKSPKSVCKRNWRVRAREPKAAPLDRTWRASQVGRKACLVIGFVCVNDLTQQAQRAMLSIRRLPQLGRPA